MFHVKPMTEDTKLHVETSGRHRNVSRETAMLAAAEEPLANFHDRAERRCFTWNIQTLAA
jgi:hypothetical protein